MKQRLIFLNKLLKWNYSSSLKDQFRKLKHRYKKSINKAKLIHNDKYSEMSKNKCKAAQ